MTTTMMPALWRALALAAFAASLTGCATMGEKDPYEKYNRQMFAFNDAVDTHALKPAATAYKKILPSFVQTGVSNFFYNLSDVWSSANNLMQGKGERGLSDITRVVINSTFGLAGLIDIASDAGLPLDIAADPWGYGVSSRARNVGVVVRAVDQRAVLLDASNLMEAAALDRYEFIRDGFLQQRKSKVFDGEGSRKEAKEARKDEVPDARGIAAAYADDEDPAAAKKDPKAEAKPASPETPAASKDPAAETKPVSSETPVK